MKRKIEIEGEEVSGKDLKLGDVVLSDTMDAYSFATVKNIDEGFIEFFRPYTHTADFSCTSGVICFVGIETWKAYKNNTFFRVRKGKELK